MSPCISWSFDDVVTASVRSASIFVDLDDLHGVLKATLLEETLYYLPAGAGWPDRAKALRRSCRS